MRALIVEDDPVSAKAIEKALLADGMIVEPCDSGEEAMELVKLYDYDIMVLDLRLPDMDGVSILRRMRNAKVATPVVILSGTDSREEKVRALLSGADDYVTKPFYADELRARVQAVIRRTKGHAASQIHLGRMCIDLDRRAVDIDGQPLQVTAKEYNILELLALRRGRPLTKEAFLDHLYGGMDEPEQKIIDVFICKLRKKIAAVANEGHNIQTIWGRGYVMSELGGPAPTGLAEDGAGHFADDGRTLGLDAELDLLLRELLTT